MFRWLSILFLNTSLHVHKITNSLFALLHNFLTLTCGHHVAYYSHNISGMKTVIYTPVCWRILVRRRHVTHLLLTSALVPLLPRLLALCHCCPLQRWDLQHKSCQLTDFVQCQTGQHTTVVKYSRTPRERPQHWLPYFGRITNALQIL